MRYRLLAAAISLAVVIALGYGFNSCSRGPDRSQGITLAFEIKTDRDNPAPLAGQPLADSIAKTLQLRLDPTAKNLIRVRAVSPDRIEVWMHYPKACQEARAELIAARDALRALSLSHDQIASVTALAGQERINAIDALVPVSDPRNALLKKIASVGDDLESARQAIKAAEEKEGPENVPVSLRVARLKAETQMDSLREAPVADQVDVDHLLNLLALADEPENRDRAERELDNLRSNRLRHKVAIDQLIAAHKKLRAARPADVLDPEELVPLVTARGRLDFRITVHPSDLLPGQTDSALRQLEQEGPSQPVTLGGAAARWFQIHPQRRENFQPDYFVVAQSAGRTCVLCYDDPARRMIHGPPPAPVWFVSAYAPYRDPRTDQWVLPFKLDAVGAALMSDLTSNNLKRALAILLDDTALTAPTIQGRISEDGIISFGSRSPTQDKKEAHQLQKLLDSPPLPAILIPIPPSPPPAK